MDDESIGYTLDDFYVAMSTFDKVVCEACAVSNFTGNRYAVHYKGYSSHIFTRMCLHSVGLISALPKTRWAKRDFECWDFSLIAPHVRALMEGYLLFFYLSEIPISEDEWYVKLNVMHLNDCTRRIRLHQNMRCAEDEANFREHQVELQQRLQSSEFFNELPSKLQKQLLTGKALMIPSREELLEKLGADLGEFNAFYDVVSNYTHILPIAYYRSEANGRGSGVQNRTDLSYIVLSLLKVTHWLSVSTERMVELFPDAAKVRKGKKSRFTLGPKENTKKQK
ncbi:hypothetical protein FLL80_11270 [Vibrio cholerae]|uniref:hypothetical protein n=1 Tax=Vibrio cholerae TaxID=666 RepID=UPI00115BEC7C|nr:hypothetical protein [Vibrio cholerae]TQQ19886.1 hypothetical protein FLL80_11270 [Vibrio cholerae]HDZ9157177.1 hypothetical protein [Vibrio cholerae]HDZ9219787.1 hypothetical protein [Vibrio cholerae]